MFEIVRFLICHEEIADGSWLERGQGVVVAVEFQKVRNVFPWTGARDFFVLAATGKKGLLHDE